jgi:hypothetical protein
LIPKKTIYILFHDTFNPEVRKGISNANWINSPYVHFVELDLIQGILQQQAGIYKQMWGGIGLAILEPKKRDFELSIQKSHELLFEAAFSKSAHQK